MPWLKLLHICAVIVWCGALPYLALAVASRPPTGAGTLAPARASLLLRWVYVGVATPAALVAIASGTAIFGLRGPLAAWLVAKLALVAMLVLVHAACGWLLLRREQMRSNVPRALGPALAGLASLLLMAVAWLVLGKPDVRA
ncbi:CopD family protein [Ramlibacter sp.]|uniref:CopD family protein n=1 Tax=Ramlibacter sp. TaxID=1917967 RepID=UPI003D136E99